MVKKLRPLNPKNKTTSTGHSTADQLAELLANTYALYLKTQNYHWNVTGPQFIVLHRFFEELYEELAKANDLIAERIRSIGGYAPGSFAEFKELTIISEGKKETPSNAMLTNLAHDHQMIIHLLEQFAESEAIQHDLATQDLYVERLQAHQKNLWMIRSHIE